MKVHAHILPFVVIVFVFLLLGGYIGEKRAHALGQCKVDWMNHPAAHEDKSSGPIKSGDYITACMEAHGYRRQPSCSATVDVESCYDPASFENMLQSLLDPRG